MDSDNSYEPNYNFHSATVIPQCRSELGRHKSKMNLPMNDPSVSYNVTR